MSLASRIEALRRQQQADAPRPRTMSRGERDHEVDNRFTRWHVPETVEREPESWLLTYLDMITLLLAMLIVLLGVSHMDLHPAASAQPVDLVGTLGLPTAADGDTATTLATHWLALPDTAGASPLTLLPAVLHTPATADRSAAPTTPTAAPADADPTPTDPVPPLAPPSIDALGLGDLGDSVDVIINEKSISFRINNELLFPSGQAILTPSGLKLIRRMATVINHSKHPVSVEGHSDKMPIQTRQFPSNWELSAGRATSVLRELVRDGVAAGRLRAVGYADTRPIESNGSAAGRAANRRVELIMEITPSRQAPEKANVPPVRAATAPAATR